MALIKGNAVAAQGARVVGQAVSADVEAGHFVNGLVVLNEPRERRVGAPSLVVVRVRAAGGVHCESREQETGSVRYLAANGRSRSRSASAGEKKRRRSRKK